MLCIFGACHIREVASVIYKHETVGSTVIPTESTIRKIVGAVLPLLEEENRQENDPNTFQQAVS